MRRGLVALSAAWLCVADRTHVDARYMRHNSPLTQPRLVGRIYGLSRRGLGWLAQSFPASCMARGSEDAASRHEPCLPMVRCIAFSFLPRYPLMGEHSGSTGGARRVEKRPRKNPCGYRVGLRRILSSLVRLLRCLLTHKKGALCGCSRIPHMSESRSTSEKSQQRFVLTRRAHRCCTTHLFSFPMRRKVAAQEDEAIANTRPPPSKMRLTEQMLLRCHLAIDLACGTCACRRLLALLD